MIGIKRRLVASVGMDRCHNAFLNANGFIENLCYGRKAIRRARCVRDNEVLFSEFMMIDAINNRNVCAFSWR